MQLVINLQLQEMEDLKVTKLDWKLKYQREQMEVMISHAFGHLQVSLVLNNNRVCPLFTCLNSKSYTFRV